MDNIRPQRWEPPQIYGRGDGFIIWKGTYPSNGALAVMLEVPEFQEPGEYPPALSVNMDHGQDHLSKDLPENCFYVKVWGSGKELADYALKTGWFKVRPDLPQSHSGFVKAPAWELLKERTR